MHIVKSPALFEKIIAQENRTLTLVTAGSCRRVTKDLECCENTHKFHSIQNGYPLLVHAAVKPSELRSCLFGTEMGMFY